MIKGNEPTRQSDLATSFADPQAAFQQAETLDRHRGRIEHRVIQMSQELCVSLQTDWPGVTHVAQLTRTRTEKDKTTIARRLSYRHPALRLRCAAIAAGTLSWTLGDREQLTLCARCHLGGRSFSHPRLLMPLALLAACRNLAIPLIHRVFLFSHCCFASLLFVSSSRCF